MSRPPLPSAIHEASGAFDHDPQRRAEREGEPQPAGPLGDAPEAFTELQREAWHEIAREAAPGVLKNADRILLEMACRLIARMRGELGEFDQPQPLKAAEYALLLTILGRMGMTPSDRARLKVPEKPTPKRDRFAEMASQSRPQ